MYDLSWSHIIAFIVLLIVFILYILYSYDIDVFKLTVCHRYMLIYALVTCVTYNSRRPRLLPRASRLKDHLIPASDAAPLSLSLIPGRGACHGPDRLQKGPHASRVG